MAPDEDLTGATTASDSGPWFTDYSARFAKTAEDTRELAPQWPTAGLADLWQTASGQSTQ